MAWRQIIRLCVCVYMYTYMSCKRQAQTAIVKLQNILSRELVQNIITSSEFIDRAGGSVRMRSAATTKYYPSLRRLN